VLHYLLKGKQPVIIVLSRGLKQMLEAELQKHFEEGRLLIITPFSQEIKRVTEETAMVRNKMMINLADEIVIGFANEGGSLSKLFCTSLGKRIIPL
jgi:hypothetical protein